MADAGKRTRSIAIRNARQGRKCYQAPQNYRRSLIRPSASSTCGDSTRGGVPVGNGISRGKARSVIGARAQVAGGILDAAPTPSSATAVVKLAEVPENRSKNRRHGCCQRDIRRYTDLVRLFF